MLKEACQYPHEQPVGKRKGFGDHPSRKPDMPAESLQEMINDFNQRIESMKLKVAQTRQEKENSELVQVKLANENKALQQKLRNLETLFLANNAHLNSNFSVKK